MPPEPEGDTRSGRLLRVYFFAYIQAQFPRSLASLRECFLIYYPQYRYGEYGGTIGEYEQPNAVGR